MLTCKNCNVNIAGERKYCPLCQSPLAGEGREADEVFPLLPDHSLRYALLFKTLIFLSIAVVVICAAINVLLPEGGYWSVLVAAAVVCMWVCLASILHRRRNIQKSIIWMVFWVSVLAVLWDVFTGWHGWSIDYVIPSACMFAMVLMALVARIFHLDIEDYMIYLILDGLFGILPLAFFLFGWLNDVLPSVLCVAGSIISLGALFSFEGHRLIEEIKRRLHF